MIIFLNYFIFLQVNILNFLAPFPNGFISQKYNFKVHYILVYTREGNPVLCSGPWESRLCWICGHAQNGPGKLGTIHWRLVAHYSPPKLPVPFVFSRRFCSIQKHNTLEDMTSEYSDKFARNNPKILKFV